MESIVSEYTYRRLPELRKKLSEAYAIIVAQVDCLVARLLVAAQIEVIDVKNYRVLCRDMYGIKGYDADAHEWVLLPTQELSPELFEEYGAYSVESDQGLDDSFETLVYDPNDEIDLAIANVVPNKLTITNEMISSIPIRKIEPEMEFDRNVFDIDILVNRRIIGDNVKILTTFEITKKMRSNAIPKIYYVSYTNTD